LAAAYVSVRVTPRSAKDEIVGWKSGALHVRVTAPPERGKANAAVCALLAHTLGVPKSAITAAAPGATR
jgi:uncharacterized protein YggU (UPF0235/DUF167 family)